ncbi:MAG: hypothetical protein HYV25_00710 [Candidatus Harrisonbacteria bacterium]|nr:hypothetical protein [Candidatus Harrisonbacteria bacterium]
MNEKKPVLDALLAAVESCCKELQSFRDNERSNNYDRLQMTEAILHELCRIIEAADFTNEGGGAVVARRLRRLYNSYIPFPGQNRLDFAIKNIE